MTVSERLAFAEALESRADRVLADHPDSQQGKLRYDILNDIAATIRILNDIAAAIRQECGQRYSAEVKP